MCDEPLTYTEQTLFKVKKVLDKYIDDEIGDVSDVISELQNEGILFRERDKEGA